MIYEVDHVIITKSEAYNGIYDTAPDADAYRVFFAFSEKQLDEGIKKHGYTNHSELRSAGQGTGAYGSPEALKAFFDEYYRRSVRVANECDPQKVYDYEYFNHECCLTYNDEDAIKIVVSYFGKERVKLVNRKHALVSMDEL
jgi:hypothetical protein